MFLSCGNPGLLVSALPMAMPTVELATWQDWWWWVGGWQQGGSDLRFTHPPVAVVWVWHWKPSWRLIHLFLQQTRHGCRHGHRHGHMWMTQKKLASSWNMHWTLLTFSRSTALEMALLTSGRSVGALRNVASLCEVQGLMGNAIWKFVTPAQNQLINIHVYLAINYKRKSRPWKHFEKSRDTNVLVTKLWVKQEPKHYSLAIG